MKALSIRQPWAWAIMHAGKRIENREWKYPPSYRGPLLIHAAKGCTRVEHESAADWMIATGVAHRVPPLSELTRGALVATARLVEVRYTTTEGHSWGDGGRCAWCSLDLMSMVNADDKPRCPSKDGWAIPGSYGFVLDDVRILPMPIPRTGELGLFHVPDTALEIRS